MLKGLSSRPFSIKFNLIDFAVSSELWLSPCIQTESILQGICFPLWQLIDWFLTILSTCVLASLGLIISALGFFLDIKDINQETLDLGVVNPHIEEEALPAPSDILNEIEKLEKESSTLLKQIKKLI